MSDPQRRRDLDDVDIDPDEALAAESEEDRNRDPGADMEEEQGVPADDRTSMVGEDEVPEPEQPAAPADAPVAATSYGTTEWEQSAGESLDDRLAEEEPDLPPRAQRRRTSPTEELGVHEEEEPS